MADNSISQLEPLPVQDEAALRNIAEDATIPNLLARIVRAMERTDQRRSTDQVPAPPTGIAETYRVRYRRTNKGKWIDYDRVVTECHVDVDTLDPSTCYDFEVAAQNAAGFGPESEIIPARTTDGPDKNPGPVESLRQKAATAQSITLAWQAPETGGVAQKYQVQYKLPGDEKYRPDPPQETAGAETHVTIRNLAANRPFDIRVRAKSNGHHFGPWTTLSAKTAPEPLHAPGQITRIWLVNTTEDSMALQWDLPAGAEVEGFTLECKPTGKEGRPRDKTPYETFETVDELSSNCEYAITVQAWNAAGTGPRSEPILAQTTKSATVAPGRPGCLDKTAVTANSISLTWQAPHDGGPVEYYRLRFRKTNDNGQWTTWKHDIPGKERHATVTPLEPSTSYEFEVLARNMRGRDGDWSLLKRVATEPQAQYKPGAVTNFIAERPTAHGVVLSWQAPLPHKAVATPAPTGPSASTISGVTLAGPTINDAAIHKGKIAGAEISGGRLTGTLDSAGGTITGGVFNGLVRLKVRTVCDAQGDIEATAADCVIIVEHTRKPRQEPRVVLPARPVPGMVITVVKAGRQEHFKILHVGPLRAGESEEDACHPIQIDEAQKTFLYTDSKKWIAF